MRFYKIRELENNEIIECIKVLYLYFGRAIPEEIEEIEKLWIYLISINIA